MIRSFHAMCFATATVPGVVLLAAVFGAMRIHHWTQLAVFAALLLAVFLVSWISTPSEDPRELELMERMALMSLYVGVSLCLVAILLGWWIEGSIGTSLMISAVACIAFVRLALSIELRNLEAIRS